MTSRSGKLSLRLKFRDLEMGERSNYLHYLSKSFSFRAFLT